MYLWVKLYYFEISTRNTLQLIDRAGAFRGIASFSRGGTLIQQDMKHQKNT